MAPTQNSNMNGPREKITIEDLLNKPLKRKAPKREDEPDIQGPLAKRLRPAGPRASPPEQARPRQYAQSQTVENTRSRGDGLPKTSRQPSLMPPIRQEQRATPAMEAASPAQQAAPRQEAQYTILGPARSRWEFMRKTLPASQLTSMQMRPDAQWSRVRGTEDENTRSPSQRTSLSQVSRSRTTGSSSAAGASSSSSSQTSFSAATSVVASIEPEPAERPTYHWATASKRSWTSRLPLRDGPQLTSMQMRPGTQVCRVRGT